MALRAEKASPPLPQAPLLPPPPCFCPVLSAQASNELSLVLSEHQGHQQHPSSALGGVGVTGKEVIGEASPEQAIPPPPPALDTPSPGHRRLCPLAHPSSNSSALSPTPQDTPALQTQWENSHPAPEVRWRGRAEPTGTQAMDTAETLEKNLTVHGLRGDTI